jgi:alkanesulfonate monooxygenase SsuD/methylene tetrahydromethanopterin reductase-like flavin-dependent oxidoreductase (luciferase family)
VIRVGIHAEEAMFAGPLAQRRALLERVRRAGLDHVFVADHVSFHTGFGMDGLVRAATIAAQEPELAVHIGVYLLALRHPVPVARQIATLCESAPGRLVLGVGVGGEDRHEIEICGVDPSTRGRRTDESLAALRALLSGEPVSHECEFFSFEKAWIRPAPDPPVPIVVGGRSGAALRRAGRLGDGWLGVWCSPKRYAEARAEVESHGAGRTAPWRHGLQVWVGLDRDRGTARDRLSRAMEGVYKIPFERFEKYCPSGSPSEIAEFLAAYVASGARDFNVMAVASAPELAIDGVAEIREALTRASGSGPSRPRRW